MDRREFLRALLTIYISSYVSGAKGSTNRSEVDLPLDLSVVDVHCHVFSAYDLPVDGFIKYVALGEVKFRFVAVLASILVDAIVEAADVIVSDEKEILEDMLGLRKAFKSADNRENEIQRAEFNKEDVYSKRVNKRIDKLVVPGAKLSPEEQAFVEQIKAEFGERELLLIDKKSGEKRNWYQEIKQKELQAKPGAPKAKVTFGFFGTVSRYIVWGFKLLRFRYQQVREIRRTYSTVDLFVPSLVDFDRWLYPNPSQGARTKLNKQMEIMNLIGRLNKGTIHPFVPFCPRRYVEEGEDVFTLVTTAIEEQGAIGVKLYPPMGFSPSDNVESNMCNLTQKEAEAINVALYKLYAWCAENDVPIMAHTANSNINRTCRQFPIDGQEWPNPKYWIPVLQKFNNLRLNLGHFATHEEFPDDWITTIKELMLNPDYPHVYADLSHVEQLSDPAYVKVFFEALNNFFKSDDAKKTERLKQRILYGSDWIMLAKEKISDEYFNFLVTQYRSRIDGETGESYKGFVGQNALNYLGVLEGKGRKRLENLYENIWKLKENEYPAWFKG